ncbi:MAG TPA: hypothetical protein VFM88_14990 [Vicinamibacteria bacterium]|nr:hypothetical protein [Vicinamibacteria bacterium]
MPFLSISPEPSAYPAKVRSHAAPTPPAFTFDWWHGDDLVGAFPHFLITARLRRALQRLRGATGFTTEPATVRASRFFRARSGAPRLPRFWRLVASGAPGVDDVGATADCTLVVSARILVVLLSHTLEQASFQKFAPSKP